MPSSSFGPEAQLDLIDGAWRPPFTGATRPNVNPADTTDVLGEFAESGEADTAAAIGAAASAFRSWRTLGPITRAEVLTRAQALLEERSSEFARTITREQGKTLGEASGEVQRSIAILDFIRTEARRMNGATTPADDPRTFSFTFRAPIGVVGLITPWNFPLAIPLWKVAPALLSGCTAVLKPSPLTPLTAALLARVFQDAGLPPGVLNVIQGDRAAGEALVADRRIAGISFTGSLPVGLSIQLAGAPRLLKTQLELGGKNALVVLNDANLDHAVDAIILGAFGQAGQRCSATSRVIVDVRVKSELLDRLVARVAGLKVGPGTDPDTFVGPVISEERLVACIEAIRTAQTEGAHICVGGHRAVEGLPAGYYVEPTVLSEVLPDSTIAQEEIFGPVLALIDAETFDDAIRIANSVRYGMSATIFTRDIARVFESLDRFEAGMLHVNRPGVGAYPHMPHIGTKLSQYGAPECSPEVWDFYTEWRSACVAY